jgi:hypothetical protein
LHLTLTAKGCWILAVALPILLLAVNLLTIPGFTGDDAFIHFTYVRNLLERGILSYNTPSPTYGSTSPLWVVLCAAASMGVGDIPLAGRILSAMSFVAAGILFSRYLLRRVHVRPAAAIAGGVFFCCNAVVFRWATTGMETSVTLLAVGVLLTWYDPAVRPVSSAALTVLAFLVRPEFLLLPIASLILLWQPAARSGVLRSAGVTGLLFIGWFAFTAAMFGTMLPLTAIKSGSGADAASLARFARVVAGDYPEILGLLLVLAVAAKGKRFVAWPSSYAERVLLLFAALVLGGYAVRGANMTSRYMVLVHPAVALLVLRAVMEKPRWIVPSMLAVVVVQGGLFIAVHYGPIRSFTSGFQEVYRSIGMRLRPVSPSDTAWVMVADVGIVGYYSHRPVIDLVGLTSTHVDVAQSRDDAVIAARWRPRYVVVKLDTMMLGAYIDRFREIAGVDSVEVLMHERIGALGVFSLPGQTFDVYLLDLRYRGERTRPLVMEGGSESVPIERYASLCGGTSNPSRRFVWTYPTVSASASRNFSKSSL